MTKYLQTSLATGSRVISHAKFEPVYIGLCMNSWALSLTLLCNRSLLFTLVHCVTVPSTLGLPLLDRQGC
jgi:hypothetical protein